MAQYEAPKFDFANPAAGALGRTDSLLGAVLQAYMANKTTQQQMGFYKEFYTGQRAHEMAMGKQDTAQQLSLMQGLFDIPAVQKYMNQMQQDRLDKDNPTRFRMGVPGPVTAEGRPYIPRAAQSPVVNREMPADGGPVSASGRRVGGGHDLRTLLDMLTEFSTSLPGLSIGGQEVISSGR